MTPPIGRVVQLGYVVRDLDAAAARYSPAWGVGEWAVHTLAPPALRDRAYRGRPGEFSMRVALAADAAGLGYELIQPLAGPSIYTEFLDRHGEGLHHLAHEPGPGFDEAVARLTARGAAVAMSGRWHAVRFAYLDGGPLPGFVEVWEMPAGYELPPPERVIGAAGRGSS